MELDTETRGAIENQINFVYQEQNMLEHIDWILEIDRELTSLNDFALGYFLGSLMHIARNKAELSKTATKLRKSKRLPKKLFVSLTEAETEEIRDIIKRWVNPFREKLNREIDVRRVNK
jgi:hypothetical protein